MIVEGIKAQEEKNGFIISEISANSIPKTADGIPVLQIEPLPNGLLRLNLNTDILTKPLEEIDSMFVYSKNTVVNSLKEAIIHESGHAKSIFGKSVKEIEEFYKELKNIHIPNISKIAYRDGAECLAELEVLRERGEQISDEALKFYEKYMGRKYR